MREILDTIVLVAYNILLAILMNENYTSKHQQLSRNDNIAKKKNAQKNIKQKKKRK